MRNTASRNSRQHIHQQRGGKEFQQIWNKVHVNTRLETDQKEQLEDLLMKHDGIFSKSETEIGHCDILASGVLRKSKSHWCSNSVLVKKEMCIDYRMLNKRTVKDSYALPRVEEVLDILNGSTLFSVVDMKSGYHQVEVEETHKERTAFTVGPLGFFEFNMMPFGLSNSPASYQRLMEEC